MIPLKDIYILQKLYNIDGSQLDNTLEGYVNGFTLCYKEKII